MRGSAIQNAGATWAKPKYKHPPVEELPRDTSGDTAGRAIPPQLDPTPTPLRPHPDPTPTPPRPHPDPTRSARTSSTHPTPSRPPYAGPLLADDDFDPNIDGHRPSFGGVVAAKILIRTGTAVYHLRMAEDTLKKPLGAVGKSGIIGDDAATEADEEWPYLECKAMGKGIVIVIDDEVSEGQQIEVKARVER